MKDDHKLENICLNFSSMLLSFSLMYTIATTVKIDIIFPRQLLLFLLIFELIFLFIKKPIFFFIPLIVGLIITLVLIQYDRTIIIQTVQSASQFFDNIISNITDSAPIQEDYKIYYFVLFSAIFSLISLISIYNHKKYKLLYILSYFTLVIYWYNFIDAAFTALIMLSFSLILTIVTVNYSMIVNNSIKGNVVNKTKFSLFLKPILLISIISLILATVLPKWNNPVDWVWFETKIVDTFPVILDFRSDPVYDRGNSNASRFNFSTTGFNPNNSSLGGKVVPNNRVVMTLKSSKPVYLRGSVKHTYTGKNWTSEEIMAYKTKAGYNFYFQDLNLGYKSEHLKSITISNKNFASTTLFSPLYPVSIDLKGNSDFYVNEDMILDYPNGIYKNESYTVHYFEELPYDKLIESDIYKRKTDLRNLSYYLQTSNTVTSRTINLTEQIVENANNDYEKALLIENYLKKNYSYTLDVEDFSKSDNPDFVDYFLFESEEGYCTYYATAMAVMLRIAGIPSRYVEGYVASEEINPGEYKVSQSNAHAWVEAFIEPVGWISFDPTPYYEVLNTVDIIEESVSEQIDENTPDANEDRIPDDPRRPNREDIVEEGNNLIIDTDNPDEVNTTFTNTWYIPLFFLAIVGILFLRIIYLAFKRNYREKRLKNLNSSERIEQYYYDINSLLGLLGFPKNDDETYYEYSNRINYKFFKLDDIELKKITDIFIKTKYGYKEASKEEIELMEKFRAILTNRYKNYEGKLKYLMKKYVLGSIKF